MYQGYEVKEIGGLAQGVIDVVMAAMVLGWVVVGLLATAVYGRLLLSQR